MDHGVVSDEDQRLQLYPSPSWPTGPTDGAMLVDGTVTEFVSFPPPALFILI